MAIEVTSFGTEQACLYCLTNAQGMEVTLTNFGARIVDVALPVTGEDKRHVSLRCVSDEDYLDKDAYVGASIIPVAGRIAGAQTVIKGQTYHFTENEPGRTLHGGSDAAHTAYWEASVNQAANQVVFSYTLPDGKNGFPGEVVVRAIYTLTEENELSIGYEARSDKDTIFNPTNHVYFNLSGEAYASVKEHHVTIAASRFAPLGPDNMPTGELLDVAGTPFDFREGGFLAQGLQLDHAQTQLVSGYDHPWLLDDVQNQVRVVSPDEKVSLSVQTNQPAVVIYTYNHGPTEVAAQHGAFSLECQALPNACNLNGFGSILLEKGQEFISQSNYRFTWK